MVAMRRMDPMPLTDDEIKNRFSYHPPSADGARKHEKLTDALMTACFYVDEICPDGREKSLAITKLEEAKMWASAAVARNPETR